MRYLLLILALTACDPDQWAMQNVPFKMAGINTTTSVGPYDTLKECEIVLQAYGLQEWPCVKK